MEVSGDWSESLASTASVMLYSIYNTLSSLFESSDNIEQLSNTTFPMVQSYTTRTMFNWLNTNQGILFVFSMSFVVGTLTYLFFYTMF